MGNSKTKKKHGRTTGVHKGRVTVSVDKAKEDAMKADAYHRGWVAGNAAATADAETFARSLAAQRSIADVRKLVTQEYGDGAS